MNMNPYLWVPVKSDATEKKERTLALTTAILSLRIENWIERSFSFSWFFVFGPVKIATDNEDSLTE